MSRNRYKVGQPRRLRLCFEQLEGKRMLSGTPTSLTFITLPQTLAAGAQSGTVKVELLNQLGQATAALANTTVALSGPGMAFQSFPGNAPITSVTILKGASTASFKFDDTVAGSDTLTAASAGLKSALQAETIVAGAPTQIVISPPTAQPVIAGIATPISIKLEDQFGNLAAAGTSSNVVTITRTPHGPTYTVTTGTVNGEDVALFSTSTTAQFFASATSTTPITSVVIPKGSTGITVYYKDLTPGMSTVTVDTANLGSFSETETIVEAASQIVFVTSSQTFTAGVIGTKMTVQLEAANGDITEATAPVTITLKSSSATGTFHDAAGDSATITTVTIPTFGTSASFTYSDTTAGTPTLTASSSPLASAVQTETVIPAAVSKLVLSPSATTFQTDGSSPTITVTEEDKFGNAVPASGPSGQTITLSTTSGTGTFEDVNGVGTHSILIEPNSSSAVFTYSDPTPGTYTLTATASGLGISAKMTAKVNPVAATQIVITPPANNFEVAGSPSDPFTVTLEDASGNPTMATENITINLHSNSSTGTFQDFTNATVTSITILKGNASATFSYTDMTAGTPTLTATDITDGFPAVTTTTTVTAAAATQAVFVPSATQTVNAGNTFTGSVVLEDSSGNVVPTTTTQTIVLSDNNGGGTFTPASQTLTFNPGTSSQPFTYVNSAIGAYTLSLSTSGSLTTTSTLVINEVSSSQSTSLTNNSFEAPATSSTSYLSGTNNGWDYEGSASSGVTVAGSPSPQSAYFNAAPPNGVQGAFMFAGATISQSVTFAAGTYSLSFFAIQPTNISGAASVQVLIDGMSVFGPTLPNSNLSWNQFTTTTFTFATSGTHTVEFMAVGVPLTSVSIDDVTIA